MKKILFLMFFVLLLGCAPQKTEKPSIPTVKYCMELRLVDGYVTQDTFDLYRGTKLEIDTYRGAYGLRISVQSQFDLYGKSMVSGDMGYIRMGVIDYKIQNILP